MSKSVREVAAQNHVSIRTVERWVKKGYFGYIQKNKTGHYVLPDDIPLVYKANGKTERDSVLLKNLVDASDLGQIIHDKMFPKFDEYRFNRILQYAEENRLIIIRMPYAGVKQLLSTSEGRAILNAEPTVQKRVFEKIAAGTRLVIALLELGIQYGPQIMQWIQSINVAG